MDEQLIYKLLDPKSFNLSLNKILPDFAPISERFSKNRIPFQTWSPYRNISISVFEMSFSLKCRFQDVFLIAYLLKDYGLKGIYPSRNQNREICIGTYLHQLSDPEKYAVAEPLNILSFLDLDPKLDIQVVVDSHFKNKFVDYGNFIEYELNDDTDYETRDCFEHTTDWSHYNDDLDMDQQSIEFWNQF
ncbi:hypothetical protein [Lunatibacter salilacus]|uniref:hypothetical protein n=1 Tax=Lunatibacter salilacus TaxID=2483804 RepID=UPI00131B5BAC|nr:hypothetical protein [Lunatibacter salilacus]